MAQLRDSKDVETGLLSGQAACRRWHYARHCAGILLGVCIVAGFTMCLLRYPDIQTPFLHERGSFSAGRGSAPLNVLVVGDWGRKGLFNQSAVAKQMGRVGDEVNADFIISVGDNFYENGLIGSDDPAFSESFSNIYTAQSLQKTWHAVLGNHDYRGDAVAQVDSSLTLRDSRWHCERSFVLSHELGCVPAGTTSYVEFFFIDTNPFVHKYWNDKDNHYDWREVAPREQYLKKQVQDLSNNLQASNATWKIVVGHHPVRSVGHHGDTPELVELIYPVIKENGADLYVNGHDHCLEHISGTDSAIQFLTSGGGSKSWRGMDPNANKDGLQFYYDGQGFMALSIAPTWIHVTFYDAFGKSLHELDLKKF